MATLTRGTKEGTPSATAKRDLTKELIAFANTRGGTLVLGIEEDGEKRATCIKPIRACRSLAERLSASIIASTDPPLASLEAVGVETEGDAGVVVFRVPPSLRAPHRDRDERECYRRSGDSSIPMTMREVQDLCVVRSREGEAVYNILNERSRSFSVEQQAGFVLIDGVGNVPNPICGLRASREGCEGLSSPVGVNPVSTMAGTHQLLWTKRQLSH